MDYMRVYELLSSHLYRYAPGHPSALAEAITCYSDTSTVRAMLDSAIREEVWIDAIAKASYLHPNGFAKIVLISSADFQLRLHVWRPVNITEFTTENIHNHRWDFASTLLIGGYRYQEFTPTPSGASFYAYDYRAQRGAPSYSLAPAGRRTLACTFDAYLESGSRYTLTANTFHRIIGDPERMTATLVLQGPRVRQSVEVFTQARVDSGPTLPLPRFSPAKITQYLGELMNEF
jgi:hypothetical protein